MTLPLIPIKQPGVAQLVRGIGWSIHVEPLFNTIVQAAFNRKTLRIPTDTQPLYRFTFTWPDVVFDRTPQAVNGGIYTDFEILKGFYLSMMGQGNLFCYQPGDSVQVAAKCAPADANGVVAVALNRGGQFFEQIYELNGGSITGVLKNGGSPGSLVVHNPGTVSGYVGYTLTSSPAFVPSDNVTCNFTYYYRCAFDDDSEDFENWSYQLWRLGTLKFTSVRI